VSVRVDVSDIIKIMNCILIDSYEASLSVEKWLWSVQWLRSAEWFRFRSLLSGFGLFRGYDICMLNG
jgi:hypothetical protein